MSRRPPVESAYENLTAYPPPDGIVRLTFHSAQWRYEKPPISLSQASFSARNHQPRRLALLSKQSELPTGRGSARRTRNRRVVRNGAAESRGVRSANPERKTRSSPDKSSCRTLRISANENSPLACCFSIDLQLAVSTIVSMDYCDIQNSPILSVRQCRFSGLENFVAYKCHL